MSSATQSQFKNALAILFSAILFAGCVGDAGWTSHEQWNDTVWSSDGAYHLVARKYYESRINLMQGPNDYRNHSFALHSVARTAFLQSAVGNPEYDLEQGPSTLIPNAEGGNPLRFDGHFGYLTAYMKKPDAEGYYILLHRLLNNGNTGFEWLDMNASGAMTRTVISEDGKTEQSCGASPGGPGAPGAPGGFGDVSMPMNYFGVPTYPQMVPSLDGSVVALVKPKPGCLKFTVQFLDAKSSSLLPFGDAEVVTFELMSLDSAYSFVAGWNAGASSPEEFVLGMANGEQVTGVKFVVSEVAPGTSPAITREDIPVESPADLACFYPGTSSSALNAEGEEVSSSGSVLEIVPGSNANGSCAGE